jgi:hypothetical protein
LFFSVESRRNPAPGEILKGFHQRLFFCGHTSLDGEHKVLGNSLPAGLQVKERQCAICFDAARGEKLLKLRRAGGCQSGCHTFSMDRRCLVLSGFNVKIQRIPTFPKWKLVSWSWYAYVSFGKFGLK